MFYLLIPIFRSVKPVNITLRLPIIVTKFTEPSKLMGPDFFNHWKNYGAKALEVSLFAAGIHKMPIFKKVIKTASLKKFPHFSF